MLFDDALPTDRLYAESAGHGLRNNLRQSTAAAHRRLDTQFSGFHLTSLAGYRRFLEASAAALLPLEAALVQADVARHFPDWPERSRSAAIASDILRIDGAVRPLCGVRAAQSQQPVGRDVCA